MLPKHLPEKLEKELLEYQESTRLKRKYVLQSIWRELNDKN